MVIEDGAGVVVIVYSGPKKDYNMVTRNQQELLTLFFFAQE